MRINGPKAHKPIPGPPPQNIKSIFGSREKKLGEEKTKGLPLILISKYAPVSDNISDSSYFITRKKTLYKLINILILYFYPLINVFFFICD